MQELELIRRDFLQLVDFDEVGLDKETAKKLLKGTINNFFDYLQTLEK